MSNAFPEIDRDALLERLEQGGAGALTVLTPNLRLAQALDADVDARQLAAGRAHWEAADVLAFTPFLKRCHEEALYSPAGTDVPTLLSDAAERICWEDAIGASPWRDGLLSISATAALAAEAWSLAHAWRIEGALRGDHAGEDAEAFAEWTEHYVRRTAREKVTDEARLPQVIAPWMAAGAVARPATIVLYAFDIVTPQQSDFLAVCARLGTEVLRCDPPRSAASVRRTVVETPRDELEHAARWARARLEAAGEGRSPRIAVVVPDLAKRRREAARVFARVFSPAGVPPGEAHAPLFNFSLGEPLSEFPLVDAALALLELASDSVAYDRVSRLIRSPFVEGAEDEATGRARLDAALRRIAPASLTLVRLRTLIPDGVRRGAPACKRFVRLVERAIEAAGEGDRAPAQEWAQRFTRVLEAAGFPGERTPDSIEYQVLVKWREALADFAALGAVSTTWSGREARTRLQRLCADILFQPKLGPAPVQVLGILESAGLAFDHLWVSGLTEDTWPIASRPHPLIAPSLQRRAGIPQASPEEALKVDQRITAAWKGAAAEVVFSNARADGDRELLASPLVADIAIAAVDDIGIPAFPQLRKLLLAARKGAITKSDDDVGPPLGTVAAKGGTAILVDQAACPFRAFAHYRLGARELERPEPGLAPLERGLLLHAMMAKLWETLKDQRTLAATDDATLARLIDEAAAHAIKEVRDERPGRLDGQFAELERKRIAELAREWLQIEARRAPFEVRMREEKMKLVAGNLQIDGRIDRIDHLEGGGLAIIDYKTGYVAVADWMGDRPNNAQLPLYALVPEAEDVRAVAFASLKTGDLRFVGVAREANILPRVGATAGTPAQSLADLLPKWRVVVDRLGEDFASGAAQVDPKELLTTCRRCDLKSLCRVHERLGPLDEGDELEDAAEEEEAE